MTCHQPGEAARQGASPYLQLLEEILVAISRIVQTQTARTLGSALPWLSRPAACVLAASSCALTQVRAAGFYTLGHQHAQLLLPWKSLVLYTRLWCLESMAL